MLSWVSPIMLLPLLPLAYYGAASLVFYVALNARLRMRLACLPFLILLASRSIITAHQFTRPEGLSNLWALSIAMWIPHAISILLIDHAALTGRNPDGSPQRWSLKAAFKVIYSGRLLNTPREAPGIDRSRVPSTTRRFILSRLTKILIYWILRTHIEPLIYPHLFLPFTSADFSPAHQTYFRRLYTADPAITLRETLLRIALPIRWIWVSIYHVDAAHCFLSLVFVCILRLDAPHEWPPLFGSPGHCTSIRGFWGGFWHRMAYRSYTNYGAVISRRVLGLRPRSTGDRFVVVGTVYALSGLVHSVVAWCEGDKRMYMLETWFYVASFGAGIAEVVVEKAFGRLLQGTKVGKVMRESQRYMTVRALKMVLGFVWVFGFFFWLISKWQFPRGYHELVRVEKMAGLWKILSKSREQPV